MRATFTSVLAFTACLAGAPLPVLAQAQAPPAFGITDNSFLIEEAFNQEAGVFQNIFVVSHHADGLWDARMGGVGWQVNLPFSKQAGRMFFHANTGTTLLPVQEGESAERTWSNAPFAGGSAIAAVTPMFNLMLESLVVWTRADGVRETSVTVSPGFRLGWNLGEKQIVVGAGVPLTRGDRHDNAVLGYFPFELPFRHQ